MSDQLSQSSTNTKVSIRTPSGELFEIECSSESDLMTALDACDRISQRAKEERVILESRQRWGQFRDTAIALALPALFCLAGFVLLTQAIAPHYRNQGHASQENTPF